MTVTVRKIGRRVAVLIPMALAREMELSEGMPLAISVEAGSIVLRTQGKRPRRPMSEVIAQINRRAYRRHNRELLHDPPVGKAVL